MPELVSRIKGFLVDFDDIKMLKDFFQKQNISALVIVL